jgi:hypothetical protein
MKKPVLLLLAGSLTCMSFGQNAQMVFNVTAFGQPYLVWNPSAATVVANANYNGGAYLVLDNPSNTAMNFLPGNTPAPPAGVGTIRTEAAQNKIRWAIGTTTGIYTIPYVNNALTAMPLEVNKTGAGVGNGSFVFSTYSQWSNQVAQPWSSGVASPTPAGEDWDNRLYMAPAGVTHMNDFFLGTPDNSFNAVNRFWTIDVVEANAGLWTNYGAKPPVTLKFTDPYADIDVVGAAPNRDALVPGPGAGATPLQAQRFNPGANKWGDYQSQPASIYAALGSAGEVSNVIVTAGNFFKAWTLSSVDNPLPIELTAWNGECDGGKVELTWSTASETNNDYFTIEKSATGDTWEEIARVEAVGNSSSETNYTYYDEYANGLAYYRLSQTDIDGRTAVFTTVAAGCNAENTEIVNAWDDGSELQVTVSSTSANVFDVILTDAQGKVMVNRPSQAINQGFTPLRLSKSGIATGLYVVTLQNANDVLTRRVFLH